MRMVQTAKPNQDRAKKTTELSTENKQNKALEEKLNLMTSKYEQISKALDDEYKKSDKLTLEIETLKYEKANSFGEIKFIYKNFFIIKY